MAAVVAASALLDVVCVARKKKREMAIPYKYSQSDYVHECMNWEDYDAKNLSKFDKFLCKRWDTLMADGYFRYTLEHIKEKTIPGKQKFFIQLNKERSVLRRPPGSFDSVKMPFNPDKFNFTKVKKEEIICELQPVHCGLEEATVNGEAEERRHLLLINVSPLAYGHCLVVPDVDDQLFQHMTLKAHVMAIEMVLLSNHPGFRVGFNSLLALASVNHQHFHTWYLDQEMLIETALAKLVCPKFYEMVGMTTRAFIFQLEGSNVNEMSKLAYIVTDYFVRNNIAHNVFVTRGAKIGSDDKGSTVRLIIWPRVNVTGAKHSVCIPVFNVAVAELAGHLPMYIPEKYETITEEEIISTIAEDLLPDEEFDRHKTNISSLIEEHLNNH